MLDAHQLPYRYREYTQEPLNADEIAELLGKLGLSATDVLRSRDAKKAGLTGRETETELVAAMAGNPSLLQRPIGVLGDRAVLGRPVEALLDLEP